MISLENIQKNYSQGYISIRKHPFAELYILNYTPLASQKAIWNEITLTSRGLIIDKKGKIISYPFHKFFEREQLPLHLIPETPPLKIYEKLDGSLGIMYWYRGTPYISTRGSFSSYQAVRATEILHTKYRKKFLFLRQDYTYLFEIIIPESRVVIDYGNIEDLFLIGVIDNTIHQEISIDNLIYNPFPLPKSIAISQYSNIQKCGNNKNLTSEGYVAVFKDNFRIKIKNPEYKNAYQFYTYTLKKYALEKTFLGKNNFYFEDQLSKQDLRWLNRLTFEITRLQKYYSERKNIFPKVAKRIYSNQFHIDDRIIKKYLKFIG
jgi:RNA ligase